MHIDSPEFQSRRALNQPLRQPFAFGQQRNRLANYVADELNLKHQHDAEILDRFRKEAEEYKRQKLHARRLRGVPEQSGRVFSRGEGQEQGGARREGADGGHTEGIRGLEREESQGSTGRGVDRSEEVRADQLEEGKRQQLIRLLQRKDKQIEKQFSIVKKTQDKMKELRRRIQTLQKQNKIRQQQQLATIQHSSYDKIRSYITEMSQKLHQNQSILRQTFKRSGQLAQSQLLTQQRPLQAPAPRSLAKHHSLRLSKLAYLNPEPSHSPPPSPQVKYQNVGGTPEIVTEKKQKRKQIYGIKSMVDGLALSRNRLDMLGQHAGY